MVSRPESDEALIQRLLPERNPDRGDRAAAWEVWQQQHEPVLLRFVRSRNMTRETDDDIVQDALLTAYLGVENGRYHPHDGVPFAAYVIGIARNKIREAQRRDRHHAALDEADWQDDRPVDERAAALNRLHLSTGRPTEGSLERRERSALLRRGLRELPEARRGVLELILAGATTNEIAQQLAMSTALVRQHKCRGLRALQERLAGYATAV